MDLKVLNFQDIFFGIVVVLHKHKLERGKRCVDIYIYLSQKDTRIVEISLVRV